MKRTPISNQIVQADRIRKGTAVVVYSRSSGNGSPHALFRQTEGLLEFCHEKEFNVIAAIEETASGRSNTIEKRNKFIKALKIAKEYGAVIVSDNLFRFIRNADEPKSDLTPEDERILSNFVVEYGVTLSCRQSIYLSEASIHKVRSRDGIRLSESAQARKGKRKRSMDSRMEMKLLKRLGMSYQKIATKYGIAKSTAFNYIKELRGISEKAVARARLILYITRAIEKSVQTSVVTTHTYSSYSSKKKPNSKFTTQPESPFPLFTYRE